MCLRPPANRNRDVECSEPDLVILVRMYASSWLFCLLVMVLSGQARVHGCLCGQQLLMHHMLDENVRIFFP